MVEKQTYVQRDMAMGVVIPELIDGDDLEVRQQSLQDGKNLRVTNGRTLRGRPGLERKMTIDADVRFEQLRLSNNENYALLLSSNALTVLDDSYNVVHEELTVPWTSADDVWIAPFGNSIVLGPVLYGLQYDEQEDTWTFGELNIAQQANSELSIPFWSFEPGVTIQPSAYTGAVNITASEGIFSADWVGTRIRYAKREIVITGYISSTRIIGEVTTELPPTFSITMASAAATSGFSVGEVVTGSESNWSGIIVEISGAVLTCVTLAADLAASSSGTSSSNFSGPTTGEEVVGPNAAKSPSAVALAATPRETFVWDEQLWSNLRGWPRSGGAVNNRIALCDFPLVPDLIVISSSRRFNDFGVGLRDDDAIARQAGNNSPRFLHIVAAPDLIILADKGCYFVKTRDGELLTPSNFQAVQFDQRGASPVRPVLVEGAIIFAERNRPAINACTLSGNVYLSWTVTDLSQMNSHLFNTPVAICSPADETAFSERYVIVVNGDGTAVAMSWYGTFGEQRVGWIPWETSGDFIRAMPLFDSYHAIIQRGDVFTLEKFNPDFFLDGAILTAGPLNGSRLTTQSGDEIGTDAGDAITVVPARTFHLAGREVKTYEFMETQSTQVLNSAGEWPSEPIIEAEAQVGTAIEITAKPWPREYMESPRLGMIRARVIRLSVHFRNTVTFDFLRNGTTSTLPARRPQDSAALPPPLKTDFERFNVFGNRTHPDMEIRLTEPGPIEITAITQEVQG